MTASWVIFIIKFCITVASELTRFMTEPVDILS